MELITVEQQAKHLKKHLPKSWQMNANNHYMLPFNAIYRKLEIKNSTSHLVAVWNFFVYLPYEN